MSCVSYDSDKTAIISLNSVNQLIFVMVKWSVFFAVRTEFYYNMKSFKQK
jgi:hypothetical protein